MDFKAAYIALAALEVILMMFFEDQKILVLKKFKLLFFILWLVGFVSCKWYLCLSQDHEDFHLCFPS